MPREATLRFGVLGQLFIATAAQEVGERVFPGALADGLKAPVEAEHLLPALDPKLLPVD